LIDTKSVNNITKQIKTILYKNQHVRQNKKVRQDAFVFGTGLKLIN